MAEALGIELVAAQPQRQLLIRMEVPPGTTVGEAVKLADLEARWPDFPVDLGRVGIFGKRCSPADVLTDGDRVELYRPLNADPKEVRRELAKLDKGARKAR